MLEKGRWSTLWRRRIQALYQVRAAWKWVLERVLNNSNQTKRRWWWHLSMNTRLSRGRDSVRVISPRINSSKNHWTKNRHLMGETPTGRLPTTLGKSRFSVRSETPLTRTLLVKITISAILRSSLRLLQQGDKATRSLTVSRKVLSRSLILTAVNFSKWIILLKMKMAVKVPPKTFSETCGVRRKVLQWLHFASRGREFSLTRKLQLARISKRHKTVFQSRPTRRVSMSWR